MKREPFFARCQCGCDIIQFWAYEWWHGRDNEVEVGISVYDLRPGLTFWKRLQAIWWVLRGSHLYVHETILSPEDQLRLAEWLAQEEE